ncbi:hypothetical protein Ccrd_001614, partial [Cynara cardunculus var. scolymus]
CPWRWPSVPCNQPRFRRRWTPWRPRIACQQGIVAKLPSLETKHPQLVVRIAANYISPSTVDPSTAPNGSRMKLVISHVTVYSRPYIIDQPLMII